MKNLFFICVNILSSKVMSFFKFSIVWESSQIFMRNISLIIRPKVSYLMEDMTKMQFLSFEKLVSITLSLEFSADLFLLTFDASYYFANNKWNWKRKEKEKKWLVMDETSLLWFFLPESIKDLILCFHVLCKMS